MRANAILFSSPTAKIHNVLLMPRKELEEMLIVVYTGPNDARTDMKKTPCLIRRNKVAEALRWLKLNHIIYMALEVSLENQKTYKNTDIPVKIVSLQNKSLMNRDKEITAVYDGDTEDSMPIIDTDTCEFSIHELTNIVGEDIENQDMEKLKNMLVLIKGQKALSISQRKKLLNVIKNPDVMPMAYL